MAVADLGEVPGELGLSLIFGPNWGLKSQKKIFLETTPPPPLSQGLDDRPPPPYLKVWIRHWLKRNTLLKRWKVISIRYFT